jgi:hypothetical protein
MQDLAKKQLAARMSFFPPKQIYKPQTFSTKRKCTTNLAMLAPFKLICLPFCDAISFDNEL